MLFIYFKRHHITKYMSNFRNIKTKYLAFQTFSQNLKSVHINRTKKQLVVVYIHKSASYVLQNVIQNFK